MPRKLPRKSSPKITSLRVPGQSLSKRLDRLIVERFLLWGVLAAVLVAAAMVEWYRWITSAPPRPVLITVAAAVALALGVWRVWALIPEVKSLKLGLRGEVAVGQVLEELRALGYEVLHDIPGDGHNVDHVLVGPGGVFVIETKTISKAKGDRRVVFDGKHISVDGMSPDRDPIAQVKAVAREVKQIIHDRAGFEIDVQPVVLYPGWFTERGFRKDVWVINENALRTTLRKVAKEESVELKPERVRQVSTAIARHIWEAEKNINR